MCAVMLPLGVNPIAIKYISYRIISYIISYNIIPYHSLSYHTSYHIYHITPYHIPYHIISYHISYHIISYHTISYHNLMINDEWYSKRASQHLLYTRHFLCFVNWPFLFTSRYHQQNIQLPVPYFVMNSLHEQHWFQCDLHWTIDSFERAIYEFVTGNSLKKSLTTTSFK
jgi:hypothetical protein